MTMSPIGAIHSLMLYFAWADYMGISEPEGMYRYDATVAGDRIRTVQNGCVVYYRPGGRNARS